MEAEIALQYRSALFARSVMQALSPDSKLSGQRMKISTMVRGNTLKVHVNYCNRIETLQATLQDIFRCIRAAESSLAKLASSSRRSSKS